VKGPEVNNESCERTNIDNGSTTPPLSSNVSQNLIDPSTTNIADRDPPTPTNTETNNIQEANKGNKIKYVRRSLTIFS